MNNTPKLEILRTYTVKGKPMDCKHENFESFVDVNRLVIDDKTPERLQYNADIRIRCAQCKTQFQFIGIQKGLNLYGPSVSFDGCEARLAIVPNGENPPALSDSVTGFTIKVKHIHDEDA